MDPEGDGRQIHVEDAMRRAWEEGVPRYQPVLQGRPMAQECGSAEVSLKNLREIAGGRVEVSCLHVGKQGSVLVCFYGGISYLATGFAVGKDGGMKVKGLAQFAAEAGLGDAEKILRHISALPSDYEGELEFPVPGDVRMVK